MVIVTSFVSYIIPDMPRKLREHVRREAYLTNEIIIKTELEIARGNKSVLTDDQMRSIRQRTRGNLLHMLSMRKKEEVDQGDDPPDSSQVDSRV